MRLPRVQINPTSRRAAVFHTLYLILLPLLVVTFVWIDFPLAAFTIIFLSKWRMFAVRPRYWLANIRANSVDITVGFSVVSLMNGSTTFVTWLVWGVLYAVWLIFLKPKSRPVLVGAQAFIAQGIGLVALFGNNSEWHPVFLVIVSWVICFSAARHLLIVFEDSANRVMSHIWALFASFIVIILSRWHIEYGGIVPQVALILSIVGYGLGSGYYIHKTSGLRSGVRTQLLFFVVTALALSIAKPIAAGLCL